VSGPGRSTCPRCAAPLAAEDAARGECPACVFGLGLEATESVAPLPGGGSPERIGRYRILDLLGEGGMGSVYLAEQSEPVRRRVALKLIKLGMDSRQVVARFEQERQALALMDHPNIARVLDAGATETGRPYFVMELARGVPITEYCETANLSIAERLELFIPVCQAIQHAHQKGIIHRDVKPSNVLVTVRDGAPVPKVIDFGVAKATQGRLTEKTVLTEYRTMLGTPTYMSPEQAELSGVDVDTRTDIYSLGVLLYELLTSSTPFDDHDLLSASYSEIQRIIREVEPHTPSKRISTLGARLAATAAQRRAEPRKLALLIRGDLDWIVMKALEKDRTRRYETASGLAADLRRYLAGEPVTAAPPSAAYRLRKFVTRRRREVAAGLALLGLLLMAIVGTSVGLIRTERARAAEERQRKVAEREQASASATAEFLQQLLEGVGPSVAQGRDTTMLEEMLARALARLDAGALRASPESEVRLRRTIAETVGALGQLEQSRTTLQRALSLAGATWSTDHAEKALLLNDLGYTAQAFGELDDAERLYHESLEMRQRLFEGDHPAIAESLNNLGFLAHARRDFAEAARRHQEALDMRRRLYSADDDNLVVSMNNLATAFFALGNHAQASSVLQEALDMARRLTPGDHPAIAQMLNNLGFMTQASGRQDQAEPLFEQSLAMRRKLFDGDCPELAESLTNLGSVRRALDRPAQATAPYEEALAMRRRLYPGDHPLLVLSLSNLAANRRDLGNRRSAVDLFREALAMADRLETPDPAVSARTMSRLAAVLAELGEHDEAARWADRGAALARVTFPESSPVRKECEETLALVRKPKT